MRGGGGLKGGDQKSYFGLCGGGRENGAWDRKLYSGREGRQGDKEGRRTGKYYLECKSRCKKFWGIRILRCSFGGEGGGGSWGIVRIYC